MGRFCTKCGSNQEKNVGRYCTNCGALLINSNKSNVSNDSSKTSNFLICENRILSNISEIEQNKLFKENINVNEKIYVALKGVFKEYLICTDKQVYIIKKGFMTGHTFGNGLFKMPYSNISNVEIDFHFCTGYFELSTGGLKNRRLNYWSSESDEKPALQPNVISLNAENKSLFEQASEIILTIISKNNNVQTNYKNSTADEIKKYKELLDLGIITSEEFEKKKKQLLDL